jgi:hypothetical protein
VPEAFPQPKGNVEPKSHFAAIDPNLVPTQITVEVHAAAGSQFSAPAHNF